MDGMFERLAFGRTGHDSTRVIFGAAALGRMSQERADATLEEVRRLGIDHLDTAASYGDSELRLAPFLDRFGDEFFLATKTGARTADGARAELERSLTRLGVDRVDLIQLHNLVEDDEWEVAHGPNGALAAMVRARDEGLVDHIGVTGHGLRIPAMHLRSLERFEYDSVLFPYNWLLLRQPGYADDVARLLAVCDERNVAVQTIKAVARRRWADDHDGPRRSWYEPLPEGPALDRAVAFVLGRPGVFLNTSSDARLLGAIVAAAASGSPVPSDDELAADAATYAMAPLFDGRELERI